MLKGKYKGLKNFFFCGFVCNLAYTLCNTNNERPFTMFSKTESPRCLNEAKRGEEKR